MKSRTRIEAVCFGEFPGQPLVVFRDPDGKEFEAVGLVAASAQMRHALEQALESLDAIGCPQEWDCRPAIRSALRKANLPS